MLTGELEIEPSSVNEASAQSFSHAHFQNYFRTSWKLKTTHKNNSWKWGILNKITIL